MNAQQAFAAYEAIRHRLPAVPRPGRCQVAENLDAISDQFDAFFLDAFGVLNIGDTAIPGVPDRVSGLQQQGKRVLVVSNAARNRALAPKPSAMKASRGQDRGDEVA